MKISTSQILLILVVAIGSLLYFGSQRKVMAQSTASSQAIINATGCSLASAHGCTTSVNWPSSFADSSYAGICSVTTYSGGGSDLGQSFLGITSQTASNVTVYIYNSQPFSVTTTINCIGVHN